MKKNYLMTADEALEMIGGMPTPEEIYRLIEYYPTYELAHRRCLLEDILDRKSPVVMAKNKMIVKGGYGDSGQSLGGNTKWVTAKLRRFVRRIVYLRLRLDKGLTKRQANQILYRDYDMRSTNGPVKLESLQRIVRGDTQTEKL